MRCVEYRCDVCGDVLRKSGTAGDVRPFASFSFGLMGDHCKAGSRFVAKAPHEVELHICHCCLAGLVSLARRTLPDHVIKAALSVD